MMGPNPTTGGDAPERQPATDTPFDGKLPSGWTAELVSHATANYTIKDQNGTQVFGTALDRTFTVWKALKYAWWRHTFPDDPSMYLRYSSSPDWMPDVIRPEGYLTLDEIGSLGG